VEPFCIQAQPHKGYDGDNGCESKRDIDGGWEGRTFFFFDRGKEEVRTDVKHDKCRNNLLDLWCI
jgi:hypothetical protein